MALFIVCRRGKHNTTPRRKVLEKLTVPEPVLKLPAFYAM